MAAQTRATYKQRCYVQALHHTAGWSTRQIATALSLKKTTVARICHVPATPKKRRYYSFFDTPTRKRLVDFITSSAATRQMTFEEVKDNMNLQCSTDAIRDALSKEGYGRRIAVKKPW
jgi:IS30 family transposase